MGRTVHETAYGRVLPRPWKSKSIMTTKDPTTPPPNRNANLAGIHLSIFQRAVPKYDVGLPMPVAWEVGPAYSSVTIPDLPNNFFGGNIEGVCLNGELFLRPGRDFESQARVGLAQQVLSDQDMHFPHLVEPCPSPTSSPQ